MAIRKVHYSFRPGFDMLKAADIPVVKTEIMKAMGIKFNSEFYNKRKDYPNIPAFLKEDIEKIFYKYGVSKQNIWSITF